MKSTALRRVLSGLALSAITRQAAAQTPIWDAPASCPEPQWQTAAELAPKQAGPKPPLSPRVEVVELDGRWRARLTNPGDPTAAAREFWGASCSEITRAALVAWSLSVDTRDGSAPVSEDPAQVEAPPMLTPSSEPSTSAPNAAAEQAPQRPEPAPRATSLQPAPQAASTTRAGAAAPAAATSGMLGIAGPVIEAHGVRALLGGIGLTALGLEREWAWKVHAAAQLGRPASSVGPLELAAFSLEAEVCARGGLAAICAGPRAELLRAVASQIASPAPAYGVLPALAVSALFDTDPSQPVSWHFELGAYLRLREARFAVEREGDVYALPGWGTNLRLGVAFRL